MTEQQQDVRALAEQLRELAEAAHEAGEWHKPDEVIYADPSGGPAQKRDADFIVAASPEAILALFAALAAEREGRGVLEIQKAVLSRLAEELAVAGDAAEARVMAAEAALREWDAAHDDLGDGSIDDARLMAAENALRELARYGAAIAPTPGAAQ